MSIVVLQLPDVKSKSETRPQKCPFCQGGTFQRWGKASKPVRDNRYRQVQVYRYRCCHCRRTFRHYPAGVDQADQTQRMRKLVSLHWVLGMSLRGVGIALAPFGVSLSHMSIWRGTCRSRLNCWRSAVTGSRCVCLGWTGSIRW